MRIATAIRSIVLAATIGSVPAASFAGVFVSVSIGAPPVLPVYAQPICPAAGYIWTPGYWAYDEDDGYYWVPGAWVLAPYTGALWTPGYWGWGDEGYLWHAGYWGPHIGFYGGVNYGFGYFGHGFEGGYWDHDRYYYNRSVTNVNVVNITNVYNKTVINNYGGDRTSFSGGQGGVQARPTPQEMAFMNEHHAAPLAAQQQNEMRAAQNRMQFANVNHGRPQNLARPEPVTFDRNLPVTRMPASGPMQTRGPVSTATSPRTATMNNNAGRMPEPNRPVAQPMSPGRPVQPMQPTMANRQPYPTPQQGNTYGQRPSPYQGGVQGGAPVMQPQRPAPAAGPVYRPGMSQEPQPQYRQQPQPQYRPEPQPQYRQQPQPQYRPEPQPQYRPAPQPQPQYRPEPQPQYRPAPQQSRPEPQGPRGGGPMMPHDGGGHGHGR